MRWTPACIVLILIAGALPVGAQDPTVIDLKTDTTHPVDLVQHAGTSIVFQVADGDFGNSPSAAFVTLTCSQGTTEGKCPVQERLELSMTLDSDVWSAELDVDDPDLVEGDWSVVATGQSGSSTSNVPSGTAFALDVTAPTVAKPRLRALNVDLDAGYVPVGKGQKVDVTVDSDLLRHVEYQIDDGPVLQWGAPYSLAANNFVPAGQHTLKVMAEDRVGQTSELAFFVYADTNDPDVSHNIPARLFRGVPNPIPVTVTDESPVTVTARIGSVTGTASGEAGTAQYAPEVMPTALGGQLVEVTVEDLVGNRVRFVRSVEVVPLEIDAVLESATQTDGGAIPREDIMVEVTASQVGGIIAVPVNVTFDGMVLGDLVLPVEDSITKTFSLRLPAGVHAGNLTLEVPADVTELNAADNTRATTLEQFMARVIYRNDIYHIRATTNGLPDVAVGEDGTAYALTLKDRGLTSVYAFTVDDFELFWNPATTVTTVPEPQDPDEDEGVPATPLVWTLMALAALAIARRR